jgi:hypothetical protein
MTARPLRNGGALQIEHYETFAPPYFQVKTQCYKVLIGRRPLTDVMYSNAGPILYRMSMKSFILYKN